MWQMVSWVRVMIYALVLSVTALNILGGMVARKVRAHDSDTCTRNPGEGASRMECNIAIQGFGF